MLPRYTLPHYDDFGAVLIGRCDAARLLADHAGYFKENRIDIASTSDALAAGVISRCSPSLQDRISMNLGTFLSDVGSGVDQDWNEAMLWAWMYLGTVAQHGEAWGNAEWALSRSLLVISFVACSSPEVSIQIHAALAEIGELPMWNELLRESPPLAEKTRALNDICTHPFVHRPSLQALVNAWREIASGFDPRSGLSADDAEAAGWLCLEEARRKTTHGG